MAYSTQMAKNWYKDLSAEELAEKLKDIVNENLYFETKEDEIKSIVNSYLDVSKDTNVRSSINAIQELLKEKTGKEYEIKTKTYNLESTDFIKYATNNNQNLVEGLTEFFNKLNINDKEKSKFIIRLLQNQEMFNDFIKNINNESPMNIYEIYNGKAKEYCQKNNRKG